MTTTDTPTCSTCGAPATHQLVDAHPDKGDLSCVSCLRFWPLATPRPIETS